MSLEILLVAALAVWRLTHLLVAEDGPWHLVVRLRRRAGDGFWGELLDCFYCLSTWVAAPFALLFAVPGPGAGWPARGLAWFLAWLALSAAAILLERATGGDALEALPAPAPPGIYHEDEEISHELLRTDPPVDRP